MEEMRFLLRNICAAFLYLILETGIRNIDASFFLFLVFHKSFQTCFNCISVVFNLFDLDANEQISKKEFKKVISLLFQENGPDALAKTLNPGLEFLTHVAFHLYDRQGSGSWNYNEWRRYAEEEDKIHDLVDSMTDRFAEEFPTLAAE
eukprot:TRINITY_DN3368_c0_g1_i3.p1 TRINITY_DN3368_c0_g1~~TRINITY_DN3368_c0_g1_i3.p1  ORF type:complete len:148 (-),score=43.00 TRINITY_DN3368_c0_g1_i3:90-533(-)